MPISDARNQLADVVNRAVYGGEPTYITRRGRRLAIVVSPAQLEADRARAAQHAVLEACRQMWNNVDKSDHVSRATLRAVIEAAMELTEDAADKAIILAAQEDRETRAEPVPWEQVKAELGL
jgi:prevent-host-death family protein